MPAKASRKDEVFVHESSYVDDGVEIGAGTKIWHFSHIMSGARIGRDCTLGQNVLVGPNVVIGDRVKIQNNVSVSNSSIMLCPLLVRFVLLLPMSNPWVTSAAARPASRAAASCRPHREQHVQQKRHTRIGEHEGFIAGPLRVHRCRWQLVMQHAACADARIVQAHPAMRRPSRNSSPEHPRGR